MGVGSDARRPRSILAEGAAELAKLDSPAFDDALRVDGETAGSVSLRECVRHAVSGYFRTLEGEPCNGLYQLALGQFERPLFEVVLQEVGGNHTRAAKVLGISRGTLRARLAKYQIE